MATDTSAFIEIVPHPSCLIIKILESQMRDFARVLQIKEAIITAVREVLPKTVIIDLSQLHFVGSVGFLAFLAIRREPTVQNVVLCNLDANVHKVFSVCKLIPDGVDASAPLLMADTVEAAIATYDLKTDVSEGQ
jgi:anti-anti-sigma regulatory factor